MDLKSLVSKEIPKKYAEFIPKSFDVVGTIAIFHNFPEQLTKFQFKIAGALLKLHSNLTSVAKEISMHKGRYRTSKIKILAGRREKETIHRENDISLKVNIETCYFSPRLATERLRIAKMIKKPEKVLVLFSGVGPYVFVIAKNSPASDIYGIELNKKAHQYALENLKINNLNKNTKKHIILLQGDAKKIVPTLPKKYFNRIILPLPSDAQSYLKLAIKHLAPSGTIHLYTFSYESELPNITKQYQKLFSSVKIIRAGQSGPRTYRLCLDLQAPKPSRLN